MSNIIKSDECADAETPNVIFTVDPSGVCTAPEPEKKEPLRAPPAQDPVPTGDEGSHPDDDGPGNDSRDDLQLPIKPER